MFNDLLPLVQNVNAYLSDYILVFMLIGVGLFYTIRTRFVQIRCFGEGVQKVFGNFSVNGKAQEGQMSSFQALATAIAAQVGTGNIVGACGAILTGGPGAIFWMWVIAFFGMATIYAEAVLAQTTRVINQDGSVHGGPVFYIRRAFPGRLGRVLAAFFAVAITLALGFMGCMVQSNSIGETSSMALGVPAWSVGLVIAVLAGFVFLGGIKRIAAITEKLVPLMALVYIAGCLTMLAMNFSHIPETFQLIFYYAFNPEAILGGSWGAALKTAISQGAKRGLFSNEAGMGSTPHAHALAQVKHPHEQGVTAMIGVFVDTFIVLTLTALVVISALYTDGGILASGAAEGISKTNMAQLAFATVFGQSIAGMFIAVSLLFFAFSTILSWNLFAKINVTYLFGAKAAKVFAFIAIIFVFMGSCLSNDLVWELADMFNNLMVIPNALALFALSSLVVKNIKE